MLPSNSNFFSTTGSPNYYALNGWNFQQCPTSGTVGAVCSNTDSSLVNVQGQGFSTGYGFWSLLNMRQVPGSETLCSSSSPPPPRLISGSFRFCRTISGILYV